MEIKTTTYVYVYCECGQALKHRVPDEFSGDHELIIEPCPCQRLPACEFYPTDGCVCDCNSDISGKFVCTVKYSKDCQWANQERRRKGNYTVGVAGLAVNQMSLRLVWFDSIIPHQERREE